MYMALSAESWDLSSVAVIFEPLLACIVFIT